VEKLGLTKDYSPAMNVEGEGERVRKSWTSHDNLETPGE